MKAIVFGVGINYDKYIEKIKNDYEIVGVSDNNVEKLAGIRGAIVPAEIRNQDFDVIILTPKHYEGIYEQLVNYGIDSRKIVVWLDNPNSTKREILGLDYWGQHCDDLILAAIFRMIGIDHPSYIDIGVNMPYEGNNTAFLYLNGCRGICIDANPNLIDSIKKCRPEDKTINIGVAGKASSLKFYSFGEKSAINTFSEKEAKERGIDPVDIIELPVTTLTNIISEYCNGVFPDFLDIDIEGLDYEVLEEYDLKTNGPAVICVEVRRNEIDMFDQLLKSKGYYRFCRIGENNIYVKEVYRDILSHY